MNFGMLEFELYMLEVGIIILPNFGRLKLWYLLYLEFEQLMVRIDKSAQLRKCLLASLESLCKISEFLDNGKTRFMLEHFSLAD